MIITISCKKSLHYISAFCVLGDACLSRTKVLPWSLVRPTTSTSCNTTCSNLIFACDCRVGNCLIFAVDPEGFRLHGCRRGYSCMLGQLFAILWNLPLVSEMLLLLVQLSHHIKILNEFGVAVFQLVKWEVFYLCVCGLPNTISCCG